MVVRDILTRCALPLSLWHGKAYHGAANMQGLSAIIKNDALATLSVHCVAHSLNLCLQDAGSKYQLSKIVDYRLSSMTEERNVIVEEQGRSRRRKGIETNYCC